MKAKVFFSALALLTTFAACSNEELTTVANENNLNDKEIVGAKLVSQGMTVNLGGIDSRVNANGWEANDQLAMAWYNIGENIFADQPETNWDAAETDDKIYANHLFTKGCENNSFVTKSNIYEGAHFLYFPYEYMAKVDVKNVNVNADPQEKAYDVEVYNKALYVSAKDYIKAADLNVETGELTKEFVLAPAVNVLKVTAKAEDVIAQNEFFGSLKITEQEIYVNGDAIFNLEGYVDPGAIPTVVRYTEGVNKGKIDREKTLEALKNAMVINSEDVSAVNGVKTVVKYDMPLSNANIIRAFTLPTKSQVNEIADDAQFTYVVAKEGYVMGQFITNITQEENKEQIEKLLDLVSKDGFKKGNEAYSLTELITEDGKVTPVSLSMNLLKKAFTADYNIKDLAEWNYTVAMVDALNSLKEEGAKDIVPTFILGADITFNEGEIKTPAAGVKVLAAGKKLVVAKDATWPKNLAAVFAKDEQDDDIPGEYLSVVVKKNVTLAVESDAATGKLIDMVPEAGATIDLTTGTSKIHLASKGDIEGARINIGVYGAKVELWNDDAEVENATIAYELPKGYKNYQVNNLIATSEQVNYALVNTLVINKGVTFNLADVQNDEVEGDPYTGVNKNYSGVLDTDALENVNIEMKGGIVNNVAVNDEDEVVEDAHLSNVIAITGNSTIKDVNVANVIVKSGATLVLITDVVLEEDDDMVSIEVDAITTEASSKITADEVVVKYGNWTNNGTSTTANGGKFEVKE